MKKNNTNKSKIVKLSFGGVFAILCILYIIIEGGSKTIENYRLEKNGICVKALVYDKTPIGSKGTISIGYYFYFRNNKFYGKSYNDDKAKIGDTILIFFLESDPNINRSNSILEIPIEKKMKK